MSGKEGWIKADKQRTKQPGMSGKVHLLGNHIRKPNGSCVVEGHGCHSKSSESGH